MLPIWKLLEGHMAAMWCSHAGHIVGAMRQYSHSSKLACIFSQTWRGFCANADHVEHWSRHTFSFVVVISVFITCVYKQFAEVATHLCSLTWSRAERQRYEVSCC